MTQPSALYSTCCGRSSERQRTLESHLLDFVDRKSHHLTPHPTTGVSVPYCLLLLTEDDVEIHSDKRLLVKSYSASLGMPCCRIRCNGRR